MKKYIAEYVQASSRQSCCPCSCRSPQHLQLVLCTPQSLIKALPRGPSLHFPNTCPFCLLRHLLRQPPPALQPCPCELPSSAAVPKPVSPGWGSTGRITGLPWQQRCSPWASRGKGTEEEKEAVVWMLLKAKAFSVSHVIPQFQFTVLTAAIPSPVMPFPLLSSHFSPRICILFSLPF